MDPETRERLAALGYIGSFTHAPRQAGDTLPDPKDKIEIFNLMTSAHEDSGKAEAGSAIARLQQVVAQDPNILDAWVMLGNEYFRQQDYRDAAGAVQARAGRSIPTTTWRPSTLPTRTVRSATRVRPSLATSATW